MGAAAGNGHQVDYARAAGSVACIRAEAISVRSDLRQVGEGVGALRMCASASSLLRVAMRRHLVVRKSLAEACNVVFPGSRWRASLRLAMCRTAVTSAWSLGAAALSGLRPSQAVCRRLRP